MIMINCDLFGEQIEQGGVKHVKLWSKITALSLRLGMFFRKMHVYRFGNINKQLYNLKDDCIVVFDNGIKENSVLKWLAKRYCKSRLIFYYWNPVFTSINPKKIPKEFELWSYSPSDCERYGMRYNSTFYFQSFSMEYAPIKRDVLFVGKNKGRLDGLKKIEKDLEDNQLSSLFYITASHPRLKQKKYKKFIPYSKVLDMVNESAAVLDYYVDPLAGLSLRSMEALFLRKKMITNNQTICNYDFYKSQNIFVMGCRPISELRSFLYQPYAEIEEKIKKNYTFCEWLKRF